MTTSQGLVKIAFALKYPRSLCAEDPRVLREAVQSPEEDA
jgi:hypothetical protein